MGRKKRIGLHQLFTDDPAAAERLLWGRIDRRGFLQRTAAAALTAALGAQMVYAEHFPFGMIPAGLAHREDDFQLPGKHPDLVILNDRPVNAETPPHLLDDPITPTNRFFVRNNGLPPTVDTEMLANWTLTIEGEAAAQRKVYTLAELKKRFPVHTLQLTLECGGNGRKEFSPPAKGNQWSTGAVGCANWTGIRLRDVLQDVGLASNAVYIGYYGRDIHLSGDPNKMVISRGVPIAKALEDESLIAWAMNGEDLPVLNGYPLRLVFGGWPASCSGKWLDRIVIRDRVHDGPKMDGQSYRVPCRPVAPGSKVADEDMCIIEAMPVKSLITFPKTGAMLKLGPAPASTW
jgi:DMSO/TMAO reductase YedYZ molybdopterin-dependent catalytic subunit